MLPSTSFTLPPLQGKDLGEHFWNIGREAAQPWLSLSEELAAITLLKPPTELHTSQKADSDGEEGQPSAEQWIALEPSLRQLMEPKPTRWLKRSGWVRYPVLRSADDQASILGSGVPVSFPDEGDAALVFDIENMVKQGPFAVMATAAGANAWYAWLSPWLLGESDSPEQLIRFGPAGAQRPRLLVGHHVSYDRARIRDEYSLDLSSIRFLDTLSLHVAIRGISSPQRPVWLQHRKRRAQRKAEQMLENEEVREEHREELRKLLGGEQISAVEWDHLEQLGLDPAVLTDQADNMSSGASIPAERPLDPSNVEGTEGQLQWQDISSTNSLADVAALHCGIQLPKDLRNTFVDAESRDDILRNLGNLLTYCAQDVYATHAVFSKVLPDFRQTCPHPATFAGVLGLGNPILPIDDEWIEYQARCDEKYNDALQGVRDALIELAEALRKEHQIRSESEPEWWASDPWLCQLDWTLKKPKRPKSLRDHENDVDLVPKWFRDYALGKREPTASQMISSHILLASRNGSPLHLNGKSWFVESEDLHTSKLTSKSFLSSVAATNLKSDLGSQGDAVIAAIRDKGSKEAVTQALRAAAEALHFRAMEDATIKARAADLDWKMVARPEKTSDDSTPAEAWPKWYWDLFKASTGRMELTIRTKIAPLLLKVSWRGCPLFTSREHGWIYLHRPLQNKDFSTRQKPLTFLHEADEPLKAMAGRADDPAIFYKVPHTAGADANVGSPFSKSFMGFFEDGTLRSEHPEEKGKMAAKDALALNAQCSYWIGVRDRVANQMVVWEGQTDAEMGFENGASGMRRVQSESARRKGLILPQVITMGTVTRRAIEKTWLTASNAKKNRVGSELKSMVKAPPGWMIVGADVDSEELWICSVMGDAQFGIHGATAIGWMTLEGTKAAGTDLHSKTASILGTSRNQAKVFNYSRIYGAGIRHATQLLLKANPAMPSEEATRLAKELYTSTKGSNTHSPDCFGRKFWYGGSESFVFNKLEDVALSEQPRTPALDCGITAALSRQFLPKQSNGGHRGKGKTGAVDVGGDFMPSRINWVVQSSGVDYLHLLITSMDHLCRTYDIKARFMLSVHDEVRYLAKDSDAYRASLALQIANLWTRAMFAFKLQMEDLPEGVAFFAQVDLDRILRKEVDDPCVTPSQPDPVPCGEALDITHILEKTNGGSLHPDGRPMEASTRPNSGPSDVYPKYEPSTQTHRSVGDRGVLFLQAQATDDIHEIRALHRRAESVTSRRSASRGSIDALDRPAHEDLVDLAHQGSSQSQQPAVHKRRTFSNRGSRTAGSDASLRNPSSRFGSSDAVDMTVDLGRRRAASASFSTSCRCGLQPDPTAIYQPASLFDLATQLPRRPVGGKRRKLPFFKDPTWKAEIRWQVYRPLLRFCLDQAQPLRRLVRQRFRKHRGVYSYAKASALKREGLALLSSLRLAQAGDANAQTWVSQEVSALRQRRAAGRLDARMHARRLASLPPPRKPRLAGSLLPPSRDNVALPRYKPMQPDHITMTILTRRRRGARRMFRRAEIEEEMSMLQSEDVIRQRLHPKLKTKSDIDEWIAPLSAEVALLNASARRDWARAATQYSPELLQKLREIKKSKARWRSRGGKIISDHAEPQKGRKEN